jgi:hypothetical protein
MGSVIQFGRRRPSASSTSTSTPAPRNHEDESWRSLLVLVAVFTATAIAMSASVVIAGSSTWAEAAPLIVFVAVFGLTKVFLANALFYVMIRSDAHSEATAAIKASEAKAAGLVIRRPQMPPGLKQLKVTGSRPRKPGPSSNVRLALLRRKPAGLPPRRSDH